MTNKTDSNIIRLRFARKLPGDDDSNRYRKVNPLAANSDDAEYVATRKDRPIDILALIYHDD